MMKNIRSISLIPLLALFLIYSAETSASTEKTLNDWPTYSNASFGFSFQYPQTLVVTNRNLDLFHMEGLVLCLDLVDKNNPNITVLRIMVSEPLDNPRALVKDFTFLRRACKRYKEITISSRKAVNCITCGSVACTWEIVLPGTRQFDIFTMLPEEREQDEPKDRKYPLRSIINSLKFTEAK